MASTSARRIEVSPLDVASRLAQLLATSYGPLPSDKLVVTAHGKAILTSNGTTILGNTISQQPVLNLVINAADAQARSAGDGSKAFIIMLDAMLSTAEQQQRRLPVDRQVPWRARLARAACWLVQEALPNMLAPCWEEQAVATDAADESTLRSNALRIVTTALGGHLGTSATMALSAAVVDATLPSEPKLDEIHEAVGGKGDGHGSNRTLSSHGKRRGSGGAWATLADVGRRRAAGSSEGGVVVIAAGGAQPSRSQALDGRLIPGGAASELMPLNCASCSMLLLGSHAASPEMATPAEARRAGLPAEINLAVDVGSRSGLRERKAPSQEGGVAAPLLDAVHTERTKWAEALRAAGVRLVLSGAPLGALTSQLLAQHGICAVPGVDTDDLRALCIVAGVSVLQQWPRASQLPELLAPGARFASAGWAFERCSMGGKPHVLVRLDGQPTLRTLVVRAPSEGLAREYAVAATRALTTLKLWLTPLERRRGPSYSGALEPEEVQSSPRQILHALPGGGACELRMVTCIAKLLERVRGTGELLPEQCAALELLSSALTILVQELHRNADRASALDGFDGRWPVLLQRLRAAHEASQPCHQGLVVEKTMEGIGLLEVRDTAQAGVLEPLRMKISLLDSVITCLTQLLALDGAVSVRRLPLPRWQRGHGRSDGIHASLGNTLSRRRRRRLDGCSSDDTDSEASSNHEDFSDDSEDE